MRARSEHECAPATSGMGDACLLSGGLGEEGQRFHERGTIEVRTRFWCRHVRVTSPVRLNCRGGERERIEFQSMNLHQEVRTCHVSRVKAVKVRTLCGVHCGESAEWRAPWLARAAKAHRWCVALRALSSHHAHVTQSHEFHERAKTRNKNESHPGGGGSTARSPPEVPGSNTE